jgi:hypothetical protein
MTLGDLIKIAQDEGKEDNELSLVIGISGTYFNLETADEQDPWNPNLVVMTLEKRSEVTA